MLLKYLFSLIVLFQLISCTPALFREGRYPDEHFSKINRLVSIHHDSQYMYLCINIKSHGKTRSRNTLFTIPKNDINSLGNVYTLKRKDLKLLIAKRTEIECKPDEFKSSDMKSLPWKYGRSLSKVDLKEHTNELRKAYLHRSNKDDKVIVVPHSYSLPNKCLWPECMDYSLRGWHNDVANVISVVDSENHYTLVGTHTGKRNYWVYTTP